MKLARLLIEDTEKICLIAEQHYLPISMISPKLSDDLCHFLEKVNWDRLVADALANTGWQNLMEPVWLPLLSSNSRIFCIGKNYRDHAREMGVSENDLKKARPEAPDIFVRFPSSFSAHNSTIHFPSSEPSFDYEGELAVIIGKSCSNIAERDAEKYIFGYTTANDGTVRRIQKRTSQFTLGKNFDRSGAIGPTLTHASQFDLDQNTTIRTVVNDSERQNGRINDMIFSTQETIHILSHITELQPGDIILTGTPAGVGAGYTPPKYLKDGDQIEIQISGLDPLSIRVKQDEMSD
ncbi:fumarylacetoacetate hydrolase family protein [Kordiimonas sp. SCSIO 12610]|uniref:fumarylacetoacetate hydrolase family protein n=1 Tax=Kordiimonas sp. SCSIO 12610 TaxID=2829597 RepID=UPI0021096A9D|nr:fumarylacetoacetate hydrolase family protein [Kordiimonas sp. SCSIO 12610]UTW55898.1 fumarylacetoacetate hydrolase family protein [Kordiimonas sp. SCSIO 12610]